MEVFWERGYDPTSIADLSAAMGLGRQSIYGAFGDKRKLFEEALDLYVRTEPRAMLEALRGPGTPTERLRAMLARIREMAARQPQCGCMVARTVASQCMTDPELARAAVGAFADIEAALTETIEAGQRQGEIAVSLPARALARTAMAAFHGLSVMFPATGDLEGAEDVLGTLEALLSIAPETS